MVIQEGLVHLSMLLLMLFGIKKNLFDVFLLHWKLHQHSKEPHLEVPKELNSSTHVVVHWIKSQVSSHMESEDQLVVNVREPSKCLNIILLAFDKVFEHSVLFILAVGRDDILPFCQSDLLETPFH